MFLGDSPLDRSLPNYNLGLDIRMWIWGKNEPTLRLIFSRLIVAKRYK